jgi:hypothetical protein
MIYDGESIGASRLELEAPVQLSAATCARLYPLTIYVAAARWAIVRVIATAVAPILPVLMGAAVTHG